MAESHQDASGLREAFEATILEQLPGSVVNAAGAPRAWTTSNIGFPSLEAEGLLMVLSERGVCASGGSACASGSLEPSPVLLAMGIPDPVVQGSLRFSFSRFTTPEEIEESIGIIVETVLRLGRSMPSVD